MKKAKYSICGNKVEFAGSYPNLVCRKCEVRAVNETGEIPYYESAYNDSDNSVFIVWYKTLAAISIRRFYHYEG